MGFGIGVTVWAVGQVEAGEPVPELFHQLKQWLNVYVQCLVNPLAFLSFIGWPWPPSRRVSSLAGQPGV